MHTLITENASEARIIQRACIGEKWGRERLGKAGKCSQGGKCRRCQRRGYAKKSHACRVAYAAIVVAV